MYSLKHQLCITCVCTNVMEEEKVSYVYSFQTSLNEYAGSYHYMLHAHTPTDQPSLC